MLLLLMMLCLSGRACPRLANQARFDRKTGLPTGLYQVCTRDCLRAVWYWIHGHIRGSQVRQQANSNLRGPV